MNEELYVISEYLGYGRGFKPIAVVTEEKADSIIRKSNKLRANLYRHKFTLDDDHKVNFLFERVENDLKK